LLRGLDKRLALKTKLPLHIAEDPLRAVVRGTGAALKNLNQLKAVLMT
jgi:rod shape-determining protein MreB